MSRQLAEQVARQRGAYLPIVMATIEAETNFRNVIGEYDAATAAFGIGFGQVHLRWHFDTLKTVARELAIPLPSQINPGRDNIANEPFRRLILGNDLLSMHLAVAVIDRKWRAAGGDWDRFTELYVGRGISARDRERRRVIWHRWKGITPAIPVVPAPVAPPARPLPVPARMMPGIELTIALGVIALIVLAIGVKGFSAVRDAFA